MNWRTVIVVMRFLSRISKLVLALYTIVVYNASMNNSMFTEDEMRQHIQSQLDGYKSQRQLADELHVSPQFLSDIINGRRPVNDRVAEFFGRKRVVLFVIPIKETEKING
jgi:hypothetical protein